MQIIDKKLLRIPSFLITALTGFILLIIILYALFSWNKITNMTLYEKLILINLFALVLSIHGVLHLGMEIAYNFNPLIK